MDKISLAHLMSALTNCTIVARAQQPKRHWPATVRIKNRSPN
jgi:hypothetical protein